MTGVWLAVGRTMVFFFGSDRIVYAVMAVVMGGEGGYSSVVYMSCIWASVAVMEDGLLC